MSDPLFGIQRHAGEFTDEVATKEGITVAERKNNKGVTKLVYPHDTKTEITLKGGGTAPVAAGVVAADALGVEGYTDGVIIAKEVENTDKNSDFNEFSVQATHYPEAAIGSAGSGS